MIAILVPVLGRPEQVKAVLESIELATTLEHRTVLIFSPNDPEPMEAARGHDNVDLLITNWAPARSDYAKKLGFGFHHTDQPWLFQGATDLKFYPGWDTEAIKVAKRTHAGVIGTNDLGNPDVKRGRHSTHSLISRDYIDYWGGTADGTGVIFSEAYDHQWTDNEFVDTAKLRRKWAFAARSIVEHLHPHWGKCAMDDTYEKATRATRQDITLYTRRRPLVIRAVSEQKRHKTR